MTGLAQTAPRRAVTAATLAAAAVVFATAAAGCGGAGSAGHAPATASASRTAAAARKVGIPAADRPACVQLLSRLQLVSLTISTSSELITNSLDKQQLGQRIGAEAEQLNASADLMSEGPIPAPLAATDRHLVTALRTFSADFVRAEGSAKHGDFQAAVDAMGDQPVVQEILDASTTIQNACA